MQGFYRSARATVWRRPALATPLALVLLAMTATAVSAGGGPENAVIIVDPTDPESVYVGHYYQNARAIPDRNVLYMAPDGPNYSSVAGFQIPALLGTLESRGIDDHIDYVIIPPGGSFHVPTVGLIDGLGCPAAVRRMAVSSVYTLAFSTEEILDGERTIFEDNRQYSTDPAPRAFDSGTSWLRGAPSESADARRYFAGFMLGFSGERGNTIDETLAMIDRSVAVDGTHPDGTFYMMRTDDIRSTPRHGYFDETAAALAALGGRGEVIYKVDDRVAVVPNGKHDALGVMTGLASPGIDAADMTLLPGAFADHITSFAGRFDTPSQVKMSRWIAKGASGSMGTVEEPCVFGEGVTGKFPHPNLNLWYYQGMSLGESLLRSIEWAPYQSLFYGDPLTRPFAAFPDVTLVDPPSGPVSGVIELTPRVAAVGSGESIASLDLMIDGAMWSSIAPGSAFHVDTTVLDDGVHDIRVIAHEDSPVATQGRWLGALEVDNHGRGVTVNLSPSSGDSATTFSVALEAAGGGATGGGASEIRLFANGRVVGAIAGSSGRLELPGRVLGAGPVRLTAVAEYTDGLMVRSTSTEFEIAFEDLGPAVGSPAPVAFGYSVDALPGTETLLDLPANDPSDAALTYEVIDVPAQAKVQQGANALLLRSSEDAAGTDELTFRVITGTLASEPATVTIRYCGGGVEIVAAPGRRDGLSMALGGDVSDGNRRSVSLSVGSRMGFRSTERSTRRSGSRTQRNGMKGRIQLRWCAGVAMSASVRSARRRRSRWEQGKGARSAIGLPYAVAPAR